jgi:hypothetical protein
MVRDNPMLLPCLRPIFNRKYHKQRNASPRCPGAGSLGTYYHFTDVKRSHTPRCSEMWKRSTSDIIIENPTLIIQYKQLSRQDHVMSQHTSESFGDKIV